MHMQIAARKNFGVDVQLRRIGLHQAQRRLRALFHHVPEMAGQDQLAAAGYPVRFDEQNISAHRRPSEAGGYPGDRLALRQFSLEAWRPKNRDDLRRADMHRPGRSLGDAHRDTAKYRADLTFEISHASLAGVAFNDEVQLGVIKQYLDLR